MPPSPILDPVALDPERIVYSKEQIYAVLPQKFEFAQLDGFIHADVEAATFAALRTVRDDEWWCRGHMPQQPIFPGILMIECCAQLCAFAQQLVIPDTSVAMGFGGIDKVRFRDSVYPPAQVILIARVTDARRRKFVCDVQAFAKGKMAFEGTITGIRLKF